MLAAPASTTSTRPTARRRLGDGRVEGDDPRPGRRPRRAAADGARDPRRDAPADGVLTRLDAMAVGVAAWRLGAGRARKEDPVQAGAGVVWHAKPGDEVTRGRRCSRCTPTSRTGSDDRVD
jgi:hypothetical protein